MECFYSEEDKTISQEMSVSMVTSNQTLRQQGQPMPSCRYDIFDGGPNGRPVTYAQVGQPVYHKWTCDGGFTDMFCMQIYSCYVDNRYGKKVDLIDSQGCAIDRHLIGNLVNSQK